MIMIVEIPVENGFFSLNLRDVGVPVASIQHAYYPEIKVFVYARSNGIEVKYSSFFRKNNCDFEKKPWMLLSHFLQAKRYRVREVSESVGKWLHSNQFHVTEDNLKIFIEVSYTLLR